MVVRMWANGNGLLCRTTLSLPFYCSGAITESCGSDAHMKKAAYPPA
jgi:hypothetical protein